MGVTLSTFDSVLRELYSRDAIERLLCESRPFLASVSRQVAERPAAALEIGIGAAVALGGLGWIIARRQALAAQADDETFVAMLGEWLAGVWARFLAAFAAKPLPALPEATDG